MKNVMSQVLEGEETQEPPEGETHDAEQGPRPSPGPRMTTRYLTKYEKARVLGTRALQIRRAAVTLIIPQDTLHAAPFS